MKTRKFKAHGATVYFYLKKRLFSFIVYSALSALAGGAIYAFFLITAVFLYLLALKRSEFITLRDNTLIINKGIFIKRQTVLNKNNLCNIKARRGMLGRIFGFVKIKLFSPADIVPLCEIILKNKEWLILKKQLIYDYVN